MIWFKFLWLNTKDNNCLFLVAFWNGLQFGRDYLIVGNEFELQSRYYVDFRTNTIGKGMNLNITITVLLQGSAKIVGAAEYTDSISAEG